MTNTELYHRVDHTLLNPLATRAQIRALCEEAIKFQTASVCIPPSYVKFASDAFGESLNICTVIGFPLGYNSTACKVFETKDAIENGADEIDMVINQGMVKDGDFEALTAEIIAIKASCADKILKVIVETCNLTESELLSLCKCVTIAGAEYIKTSTGFASSGANFEVVKTMRENVGESVKIKAAGGIRTREDMVEFVRLGADRLGTSSALKILEH